MKRIFVNGTFDILHRGHIEMLNYAKSLGDHLTVAIDSDSRVERLKGKDRPIHSVYDRTFFLQNLKAVDTVLTFDSDLDLEHCIKWSGAKIMVKGSDYINNPIIGSNLVDEVIFFDIVNGYSTTKTIQNIINR